MALFREDIIPFYSPDERAIDWDIFFPPPSPENPTANREVQDTKPFQREESEHRLHQGYATMTETTAGLFKDAEKG